MRYTDEKIEELCEEYNIHRSEFSTFSKIRNECNYKIEEILEVKDRIVIFNKSKQEFREHIINYLGYEIPRLIQKSIDWNNVWERELKHDYIEVSGVGICKVP